jgi:hypothetical protein
MANVAGFLCQEIFTNTVLFPVCPIVSMRSSIALVFILILTASSIIMVKPTLAQTTPSIPEFSLKLVDNSYDVLPTFEINQYTGENVTIQAGYHIQNKSVELTIMNQPFTPYKDANGMTLKLYYNIRLKGHFGDYWEYYNSSHSNLVASSSLMQSSGGQITLVYPNSPSTVLSYALWDNNVTYYDGLRLRESSSGGQVDFQVEAFIGYYITLQATPDQFDPRIHDYSVFTTVGESGWSETKTIAIPTSNPSPSPSISPSSSPTQQPTLEPTQTVSPIASPTVTPISGSNPLPLTLGIVAVVIAVTGIAISLGVYFKKRGVKPE